MPTKVRRGAVRRWGLCLLLLAAVLAAYAPALLHGGFAWDDYKFVEANPRLAGPEGLKALWLQPGTASSHEAAVPEVEVHWFPMLYTSFWIERRLWGSFRAPGFHGTNLLIHFCNALLAWGLLARLRVPGSFLVALIWAVHPGAMEAVGFVMGRKDLLPATFMLLAIWVWLRPFAAVPSPAPSARADVAPESVIGLGRDTRPRPAVHVPTWPALAGTVLLGTAGMLCKTTAMVLPMLLLLLHLWRGDPLSRGLVARLAVLQAVLAGVALFQWFVFARLSDPAVHDFSFVERILLAARAAWTHLFLTLVPGPSPLRFQSWTVSPTDLAGWVALVAWGIVLAVALRLRPLASGGTRTADPRRSPRFLPAGAGSPLPHAGTGSRFLPAGAGSPLPHAGAGPRFLPAGAGPLPHAGAGSRFLHAGAGIGLLWFLVCLSPTLGLVDHPSLHMSLAWSRYRYLASLGPWALAVGLGLSVLHHVSRQPRRLPRALGRGALRGVGLAVLLTAGITTARFSTLFSNDATWFQHLARHAPASDWIASHFVNALIRAGHTGRALRITEARFLSDPSRLRYRRDRAIARMAAGRRDEARADFRALVSLLDRDPGLIPPPPCVSPRTLAGYWPLERDDRHLIYLNYGILLSELDRPFEARDMFSRSRQVRPGPGDVWVFRTDPPMVAVGPPAGSGERECAPWPSGG